MGRDRTGTLGDLLNTNPLALKHLMNALMEFYVEVEATGTHTQFYDKFGMSSMMSLGMDDLIITLDQQNIGKLCPVALSNFLSILRRYIAFVLKVIWDNPVHKAALETVAKCGLRIDC